MRKKLTWFLPFTTIGVLALPIYQAVACSASAPQATPIYFNNQKFNSASELATWAETNLETTPMNGEAKWSVYNGARNIYYDTPTALRDALLKNNVTKQTAYVSESINDFVDQAIDLTAKAPGTANAGRILNYPLSNDPSAITKIYRGLNGTRFESEEEAAASYLQVHNAYLFDNKYFVNKEALEQYLQAPHATATVSEVKWWTQILNQQQQVQSILKANKPLWGETGGIEQKISSDFNQDPALRAEKLQAFISEAGERVYYDAKTNQYYGLNLAEMANVTLPYIKIKDSNMGTYLVDIHDDTPGTMFAPYVLESERDPNGMLNNSDQWQRSSTDKQDIKQAEYTGSILNMAYALAMQDLGFDSITSALFDLAATAQTIGTSDVAEIIQIGNEFVNLFSGTQSHFAYDETGTKNLNVKDTITEFEANLKQGKRYGILTSLPLIRSVLIDYVVEAQKSNEYFVAINNAFDALLRILDVKIQALLKDLAVPKNSAAGQSTDEVATTPTNDSELETVPLLSDEAKHFRLSEVFQFRNNEVQFAGTDTYLNRIISGKSFNEQQPNPGGVELGLVAAYYVGTHLLIGSQTNYLNEVINYLATTNPNTHSTALQLAAAKAALKNQYQFTLPTSFDQLSTSENAFKTMHQTIKSNFFVYDLDHNFSPDGVLSAFDYMKTLRLYETIYPKKSTEFDSIKARLNRFTEIANAPYINYPSYDTPIGGIDIDQIAAPVDLEALASESDLQEATDQAKEMTKILSQAAKNGLSIAGDFATKYGGSLKKVIDAYKGSQSYNAANVKNAIINKFGTLDKYLHIAASAKRTEFFMKAMTKMMGVANMISKSAPYVKAIIVVVDTVLNIIDAIEGKLVHDTYEYNDLNGATYYWNGGSHKDHKLNLFGVDLASWTSDEVGPSAIKWLPMTSIVSPTSYSYYTMGERSNDLGELRQKYLQRIMRGELTTTLGYRITLVDSLGNQTILEGKTASELATKIEPYLTAPDKAPYRYEMLINDEGKIVVTPGALKDENVKKVMGYIKPLWIAQKPILKNNELTLQPFRLPYSDQTPLYPSKPKTSDGLIRSYYTYDPNVGSYLINKVAQTSKTEAEIRQLFISLLATEQGISSKWALKADVYHETNFDQVPSLIDGAGETSQNLAMPVPFTYYVGKTNTGEVASFLDQGAALRWVLASMNFTRYALKANDKWYWYNQEKFMSIADFVRYVINLPENTPKVGT